MILGEVKGAKNVVSNVVQGGKSREAFEADGGVVQLIRSEKGKGLLPVLFKGGEVLKDVVMDGGLRLAVREGELVVFVELPDEGLGPECLGRESVLEKLLEDRSDLPGEVKDQ